MGRNVCTGDGGSSSKDGAEGSAAGKALCLHGDAAAAGRGLRRRDTTLSESAKPAKAPEKMRRGKPISADRHFPRSMWRLS